MSDARRAVVEPGAGLSCHPPQRGLLTCPASPADDVSSPPEPAPRSASARSAPRGPGRGRPAGTAARPAGAEETRTLDELYQAALAEGGKLVVYAGGDTPTQQDGTKAAFRPASRTST